jgi:hypothetical protein
MLGHVQAGHHLAATDVAALEARVAKDERDLEARLTLAGYYCPGRHLDTGRQCAAHLLWLVDNGRDGRPGLEVFRSIGLPASEAEREAVRAAWRRRLQASGSDAEILVNAALASFPELPDDVAGYLRRAGEAAPGDARLGKAAADLYWLLSARGVEVRGVGGPQELAKMALARYEEALRGRRGVTPSAQLVRLGLELDVARSALAVGELEKARQAGEGVLEEARAPWLVRPLVRGGGWAGGEHLGHTVLGRVALRQGDIAGAREHLRLSAEISRLDGADVLEPDTALMRELLAAGERDAVLRFLEVYGGFWTDGREQLAEWSRGVKEGRDPFR